MAARNTRTVLRQLMALQALESRGMWRRGEETTIRLMRRVPPPSDDDLIEGTCCACDADDARLGEFGVVCGDNDEGLLVCAACAAEIRAFVATSRH